PARLLAFASVWLIAMPRRRTVQVVVIILSASMLLSLVAMNFHFVGDVIAVVCWAESSRCTRRIWRGCKRLNCDLGYGFQLQVRSQAPYPTALQNRTPCPCNCLRGAC